jgi:hypothetical protein
LIDQVVPRLPSYLRTHAPLGIVPTSLGGSPRGRRRLARRTPRGRDGIYLRAQRPRANRGAAGRRNPSDAPRTVLPPGSAALLLLGEPGDDGIPSVPDVPAQAHMRDQPGSSVLADPPFRHMQQRRDLPCVQKPVHHPLPPAPGPRRQPPAPLGQQECRQRQSLGCDTACAKPTHLSAFPWATFAQWQVRQ